MAKKPQRRRQPRRKTDAPRSADDAAAWHALSKQFPAHPALAGESIYALPSRLIDVICQELPTLFSVDDEEFERELAAASPVGFFRQQPIWYPPLGMQGRGPVPVEESELDRRFRRAVESIESMRKDEMRANGASNALIEQNIKYAGNQVKMIEEWRSAYAAWLVTSAAFRRDRDNLRAAVSDSSSDPVLPRMAVSITGRVHEDRTEEFVMWWLPFLRKWGLEGLATWDLPLPMQPEMAKSNLYPAEDLSGAGLLVFLPWYLLRHRGTDFYALAELKYLAEMHADLGEWLRPAEKNWGASRYYVMLQIFVFLELALKPRYGDRLRGKMQRLDFAVGRFLASAPSENGDDADMTDSVKRVRLHMAKRLEVRSN
jgi:hypothetical protein